MEEERASLRSYRLSTSNAVTSTPCREHPRNGVEGERGEGEGALAEGWAVREEGGELEKGNMCTLLTSNRHVMSNRSSIVNKK